MKITILKLSSIYIPIRKYPLPKIVQFTIPVISPFDKFQIKRFLPIGVIILTIKTKTQTIHQTVLTKITHHSLITVHTHMHPPRSLKSHIKCLLVLHP